MFGRANWDKLWEHIFKNFEIAWVKRHGWLFQKSPEPNKWLLVNYIKPRNTLYWNQHLLTAGNCKSVSSQLQNSGQLQNNTVNGEMTITINRVIIFVITRLIEIDIAPLMVLFCPPACTRTIYPKSPSQSCDY